MNVARGGTLVQDVPERAGHDEHRRVPGTFDGADHDVRLRAGSLAARAAGEERHAAKSHHHQGVEGVGRGAARSPAGPWRTSCPRRSRTPGAASPSASSGTRRPTRRAALIAALVVEAAAHRAAAAR